MHILVICLQVIGVSFTSAELQNLPVDVSIIVFGLLQCMSNVALCHSQLMTHHACNKVPIAVVADQEVWVVAMPSTLELTFDCLCCFSSKSLQVRPHFKSAFLNDLAFKMNRLHDFCHQLCNVFYDFRAHARASLSPGTCEGTATQQCYGGVMCPT